MTLCPVGSPLSLVCGDTLSNEIAQNIQLFCKHCWYEPVKIITHDVRSWLSTTAMTGGGPK